MMLDRLTARTAMGLLVMLAAAPLAFALISQYGFGLWPCEMCHWQRWPYFAVLALGVMGWFIPSWTRLILGLAAIFFLANAGLAFFHVGVEQGWWQGVTACAGAGGGAQTIEELRQQLMNAPLIRCDEPTILFAGLSMAAGNMIYALAAAAFASILYAKVKP